MEPISVGLSYPDRVDGFTSFSLTLGEVLRHGTHRRQQQDDRRHQSARHSLEWRTTLDKFGGDSRIDEAHDTVELADREIDGDTYHLWPQKLSMVIVAEKEVKDDDNPVQYLVTNKIDVPSAHPVRSYGYRWWIGTLFVNPKQDLDFADLAATRSNRAGRH